MFKLPNEIVSGIEDYKKSLDEFINGKMNENRFKGIRVPWGLYSHRGGKLYMSRIRVPSGSITGEQLRALAEASKKYGDGILHITTRQDIQIHNVKIENTAKIMDFLKGYNLSPRGGGGNTVRNIISCPKSGVCRDEVFDVRACAIGLTEYLLKDPNSFMLPRKYKIAFSGCGKGCGLSTVNDLGFIAKIKDGKAGFTVYAGGGMGAISKVGDVLDDFIPLEDAGYVAEAVKRVFFKHGERKDRHHARLRFLVSKIGFNEFHKLYIEELKKLKETEYIKLRKIEFSYPDELAGEIYDGNSGFGLFKKYNAREQKQNGHCVIEIKIPLGDIPADKVIALTEIGNYEYRTSLMQNIYIVNIRAAEVYNVYKKLKELDLAMPYASTVTDIVCCAGASTCNLGLCDSKGLVKEINRVLEDAKINVDNFRDISIKINGCPNACGQHPIASIGLHGLARKVGQKLVPFYKILLGGRFGEGKAALAMEAGIAPARNIPQLIKEFLLSIHTRVVDYDYILNEAGPVMREIINKYAYVPSYEEDPSFYKDWGKEEDFTLAGIGPGECGAGVIDMIQSDLESANRELVVAKEKGFSKEHIKEAIHFSARALLVVRGIEPKTQGETIDSFVKEFAEKGIADTKYKNLKEKYKDPDFDYASGFYNEVKRVYGTMDPGFNFPTAISEKTGKEEAVKNLLNLRGVACPMNYVKTKLYLENLDIDSVVEVLLDSGEPIKNVPNSLKSDGQEIISIKEMEGYYSVVVRKKV